MSCLQENEKIKAESAEKTKKIELLNDKISDLLQKNQRYFSSDFVSFQTFFQWLLVVCSWPLAEEHRCYGYCI